MNDIQVKLLFIQIQIPIILQSIIQKIILKGLSQTLSNYQKKQMFITLSEKNKQINNNHLVSKIHAIDLKSAKCVSKKLKTQLNSYDIMGKLKIQKRKATYRKPYFQIKSSIINECQEHVSTLTTKDNSRQRSRANSIQSIIHQQFSQEYLNKLKQSQKKYKPTFKQAKASPQINKTTRSIMLDWLFQLWSQLSLPKNVLYNAIQYADKFVNSITVKKSQYQKIGLCALFMATKLQINTFQNPVIFNFLDAMNYSVSQQELIQTQRKIVKCLKFKLNPPTLYQIMILLIFMMKSFKTIYNKFDWASLPLIQKNDSIYLDILWMLDGITIQGYNPKFSKQDICLSIIYIGIKKKAKQPIFTISKNDYQHEDFDKQNLFKNSSKKVGKFEISFQCFMSYVCSKHKTINQLYQCIESLEKWSKIECKCLNPSSQECYHTQLREIVLKKKNK